MNQIQKLKLSSKLCHFGINVDYSHYSIQPSLLFEYLVNKNANLFFTICFQVELCCETFPHSLTFPQCVIVYLQILVHVGFLTEESGDVFSPKVLKGGPLGEMVQWADILTALHVLGHNLKISMSVKELQG